MTLPVLYQAIRLLHTLRYKVRIALSGTSHRTIRASSAGRKDRAAVAGRGFDMATFPNKDGETQPKTMESRITTLKDALQSRITVPSSVPTLNPPGGEEKTNHTPPGPIQIDTPDLPDQKDLYLPGNVERWYLAAFFWIMIVCGWSDGTT
jgi:hypothetical protein